MVELVQRLVDLKAVVVAAADEVFDYYVKLAAVREREACLHEQLLRFLKTQLKRHSKRYSRLAARLVEAVSAQLREQLAVDLSLLVALCVGHSALVDLAQNHFGKTLVHSAESVAQADYLSLADIVFYMDVLSRAYQRMGKGTGDRTELEMAVVKLCSPELDVTNESIAARITALEQAVRKGIAYASSAQPAPMPVP